MATFISKEQAEAEEAARAAYTWDDCVKDLALLTPLRLHEASQVVYEVRASGLTPYDALPHLKFLFDATQPVSTRAAAFRSLLDEAALTGCG